MQNNEIGLISAQTRKDALERVGREVMPVEPRILLDAVLNLDPGGAGLEILHAVAGSLDAQQDELDDLFDTFEQTLAGSLGAGAGLFDPSGGGAGSIEGGALSGAEALVADIRAAIGAASAAFEANLETFVTNQGAGISSAINGELQMNFGVSGLVDGADLERLVTIDNLASEADFDDAIEDRLRGRLETALNRTISDPELDQLQSIVSSQLGTAAAAAGGSLFSVELTDIVDAGGHKVVSFTNDVSAPAGASIVDVSVTPSDLAPDLGTFFGNSGFGLEFNSAGALSLDLEDLDFDFQIRAQTAANSFSLAFEEFSLSDFTIGGVAYQAGPGGGLEAEIGLLRGTVERVEMAEFRVEQTGIEAIDVETTYDFTTHNLATIAASAAISVDASIREVGGGMFESIVADEIYELVHVDLVSSLTYNNTSGPLSAGDLDPANRITRDFTIGVRLDGIATTQTGSLQSAFRGGLEVGIEADASGLGLDAAEEEAFEALAANTASVNGDAIGRIFRDLSGNIADILNSAFLDFELPFFDLRFSDAFDTIAEAVAGLAEDFSIDLAALGFAEFASLTPAQVLAEGAAVNLAAFASLAEFTLIVPGAEDVELTVHAPDGIGFDSAAEIAAAINLAITDAQTGTPPLSLNVRVDAEGGRLLFSLIDPQGAGAILDASQAGLLANLGFGQTILLSPAIESFDFGTIDLSELGGVESLVFTLTSGEVARRIAVPAMSPDGGFDSLADLCDALNSALAGSNLSAAINMAGDGIEVRLVDPEGEAASFGIRVTDAVRAQTLDGLYAFVDNELANRISGAGIGLDATGQLQLRLPGLGDTIAFEEQGILLAGLGGDLVGGLGLDAELAGEIQARLDTTLVLDLAGYAGRFQDGASGALTEQARGTTAMDGAVQLYDHVQLRGTELFGRVQATATDIEGTADLGLFSAVFGETDPAQNSIELDAQLLATLVGGAASSFGGAVSFSEIGEATRSQRVSDIVGRLEVAGGILADSDGLPQIDVGGMLVHSSDILASPAGQGSTSVVLAIRLDDVRIRTAGIGGLPVDAIDGLTLTLADAFDPQSIAVDVRSPFEAAVRGINFGNISDTLGSLGALLQAVDQTLEENLAFLGAEIPVLNFALLDLLDFSSDFLDGLQSFANNPDFGLDELQAALEDAFGLDNIEIAFDGADADVLTFGFEFRFDDLDFLQSFAIDLLALLGEDGLEDALGPVASGFILGLVDSRGDASFAVDADLTLDLAFGIDFGGLLSGNQVQVGLNTALEALSSVAGVVSATVNGRNELRVTRFDRTTGMRQDVNIRIEDARTVGDIVALINDAVGDGFGFAELGDTDGDDPRTLFTFDEASGQFRLTDLDGAARDTSLGLDALFGAGAGDASNVGGVPTITGIADLSQIDPAAAYRFDILVNGSSVTVEIAADAGRADSAALVEALNEALDGTTISRGVLGQGSPTEATVALSRLVSASLDGTSLILQATGFAVAAGYEQISLGVAGANVSHVIEFAVSELNGSNFARLLGFASGEVLSLENAHSDRVTAGEGLRAFVDTQNTELRLEARTTVDHSLNAVISFGPRDVNVSGGTILLGSGEGNGAPARIVVGFNDIDGDDNVGQLDLSFLRTIEEDANRSEIELLTLDIAAGLDVDLSFSESSGHFDPSQHGFSYHVTLAETLAGSDFSQFDPSDVGNFFAGDLIDFAETGSYNLDGLDLDLPDLGTFFSDFRPLELIDNPLPLLFGLDLILQRLDLAIQTLLDSVRLPIIGNLLGLGVTIFQDLRFELIEPALAYALTPLADGSLPTTADLLNGFLNDQFNIFFGTDEVTYLQAVRQTEGPLDDPVLVGVLSFSGELFSAVLDIGFDLGLPGLGLEVQEGTGLSFSANFDVDIGFGIDRFGFFLFNDVNEREVEINFVVDAGNFQGAFSLYNLLRVSAYAVADPLPTGGQPVGNRPLTEVPDYDAGERGQVALVATLGANLFGNNTGGLNFYDTSDLDLTETDREGFEHQLIFERIIRVAELNQSNFVDFSLTATIDVNLQLVVEAINPLTGDPIAIGGAEVLPRVVTELVFEANFDLERADRFQVEVLLFHDLRVDISTLYNSFIRPVLDPILPIVQPLAEFFNIINVFPVSFILDQVRSFFPVLNLPLTIADIIGDVSILINTLAQTGGFVVFGTFDLGSNAGALARNQIQSRDLGINDVSLTEGRDPVQSSFGSNSGGIRIDIPLISSPISVLNLILGRFDAVSLIEVEFSLINIDFQFDLVNDVVSSIGAPSLLANALRGILQAQLDFRAFVGFTVGYDLSGIVNFINTQDADRLLDGLFIDSSDGGLVDFYIRAFLRAFIGTPIISGGLEGGGEIAFRLGFNDPNRDGRLRIPEIIAIAEYLDEINADFPTYLETVFRGSAGFGLFARVFASINLFFFSIDFGFDIVNVSIGFDFGGLPIEPRLGQDISETGGQAVLNVGSRAALNLSQSSQDGNETIRVFTPVMALGAFVAQSAPPPIRLEYTNNGRTQTADLNPNASAIIIPAGEGDNEIDLSGLAGNTPTLTFTGSGDDTVYLPSDGFHVVFTGDGNDRVEVAEGAIGTYWIFAGADEDVIQVSGGNSMVFSADDFGLRDRFIGEFMNGGFSQAAAEAALASVLGDAQQFRNNYTATTQTTADRAGDSVTLGAGDHTVFAGGGDDTIETAKGSGNVEIFAGGGNDRIVANGLSVFVEGGAGSDLIRLGDGTNEAYGYAKALGVDGLTNDQGLNSLANQDGDDVIIGGAGQDSLYGQRGNNIIEGGLGDDLIHGGRGSDIVTGGVFEITDRMDVSVAVEDLYGGLPTSLIIVTADAADGDDRLYSDGGRNLVFGGGGDDILTGGTGSNILIGDFGEVDVSMNGVAEGFRGTMADSANSGNDMLAGGSGADILIAGGAAAANEVEFITDAGGSNILIGDTANIFGTRILEQASRVTSVASTRGNIDEIRSGNGYDIIIGGEQGDLIETAGGSNILIGDLADIDLTNGRITAIGSAAGGADTITAEDNGDNPAGGFHPINLIVGGEAGDIVSIGRGDDALLGDGGEIVFDVQARSRLLAYVPLDDANATEEEIAADMAVRAEIAAMVRRLSATSDPLDGDDMVTDAGGNNLMILGGGNDRATIGAGDNIVLGDSGSIDLVSGRAETSGDDLAGDDTIMADRNASGINIVLGGSGNDMVVLGHGDNLVIGDTGEILFDLANLNPVSLVSAFDTRDGDDMVEAGNGHNTAILGAGGDRVTFGNGNSRIVGDSGSIVSQADDGAGFLASSDTDKGGDDTIATGSGDDFIIGGFGADMITSTNGDNVIIGDSGHLRHVALFGDNRLLTLRSLDPGQGGDDDVETGDGHDILVGGAANDRLYAGNGDNILAGDWVAIETPLAGGGTGSITSSDLENFGDDTLGSGSGNDILVGGGGSDTITVGSGFDTAFGDDVAVTYVNRTDIETIELINLAEGGDDTITSTGEGDDILVGQAGRDTITAGDGDDVLIGDLSLFEFVPRGTFERGESHVERLVYLEYIRPDVGYSDTIRAGDGRDLVLGGFGNDFLYGEDGQDLIFGDAFLMDRAYVVDANGALLRENIFIRSNFAYLSGGYDILDGGDGADVLVGHLGPDGFFGNTLNDFLAGDAIFIFMQAAFDADSFNGARFLDVVTVNFPGFGGPDVVSNAQVNQSIGSPLEATVRAFSIGHNAYREFGGTLSTVNRPDMDSFDDVFASRAQLTFDLLLETVDTGAFVANIAELLEFDIERLPLIEAIREEFVRHAGKHFDFDLSPLDRYLLDRIFEDTIRPVIDQIFENTQSSDEPNTPPPAGEAGLNGATPPQIAINGTSRSVAYG